jgi:hypothetical protein
MHKSFTFAILHLMGQTGSFASELVEKPTWISAQCACATLGSMPFDHALGELFQRAFRVTSDTSICSGSNELRCGTPATALKRKN